MKKISIIVTNYNKEKYIKECIDSLLRQTYKNLEIIIVDDGSTDNSRSILKKYEASVKIIYQENKGVSNARNTGIKSSSGELIMIVDGDDFLEPDYIENILRYENNSFLISGYKRYYNDQEIEEILPKKEEIFFGNCLSSNIINSDTIKFLAVPYLKLYNKEIINTNNLEFNEKMNYGEDLLFVLKYMSHVKKMQFINASGYNNRIVNQSLSRKYLNNIDIQLNIINNFIQLNSDDKNLIDYLIFRNIKLILKNAQRKGYKKFKNVCRKLKTTSTFKNIDHINLKNKILYYTIRFNINIITYVIINTIKEG